MTNIDSIIEKHVGGMWSDNPGGSWLEGQQKKFAQIYDTREESRFIFRTSPTAGFKKPLLVKIGMFNGLPGIEGEERKIKPNDPTVLSLADDMRENGYDEKFPVFVNVDPMGNAWVNNGNHRMRAAKIAGLTHIPVNVQYYGGGEDKEGRWSPERVKRASK